MVSKLIRDVFHFHQQTIDFSRKQGITEVKSNTNRYRTKPLAALVWKLRVL
jgi:hypothetical protein